MTAELVGQVAVIPGSSNLIQWLICKVTGSHCAHMIVCTGPNECVSADGPKVNVHPLTDWPQAVWSRFDLTPVQVGDVVRYAHAQVGKPYAYLDDGLIALERIFRFRFPAWVRERFAFDGQLQCAQLADFALNAAGIQAFDDDRMLGDVYPGSFEQDWVTKKHWYTEDFFKSFPQWRWR